MNMKTTLRLFLLLAALTVPASSHAQGTAFTYQGRLDDGGGPGNAIYDFRFTIYGAASNGTISAGPVDADNVGVTNGLFTVPLDFGANIFTGGERWLEIGVRPGASVGAFTLLEPRQPITATPYAITAGQVTGAISDNQLSANVARLDSDSVFTGAVVFSNTASQFTGSFAGNGAAVTNVNLATVSSFGAIVPNSIVFRLSSSPGVGGTPVSVVAADVNGDGKPDLISANYSDNSLTVLTNNGSAGFGLAASLAVGVGPRPVRAADVNGDGWVDLICGNVGSATLTVLTNNRSGGFALAASAASGTTKPGCARSFSTSCPMRPSSPKRASSACRLRVLARPSPPTILRPKALRFRTSTSFSR